MLSSCHNIVLDRNTTMTHRTVHSGLTNLRMLTHVTHFGTVLN
jgi:hypothetical protein